MQLSTRKKIEKSLTWLIAFMLLFLAVQYILNFDFFGKQKLNKKQAELLRKVDEVEKAYFGISPYWLRRYNITLKDKKDTFVDFDNDGLNLAQEFQYLTDPSDPDTDKDGYRDGEEVQNSYNPLGGGLMDRNKNGLPDFWESENGLPVDKDTAKEDPDNDGLINEKEFAHGTNPAKDDSDGDGYTDLNEIANGYDPMVPGSARIKFEVFIKKINITAPVVLSKDATEAALQEDLKSGVLLYPKSAYPGQTGNSIITGHSSNYAWAKGQYNYIFRGLNSLEIGDEIEIKATQQNGKSFSYKYRILEKGVFAPDDQKIFEQTDKKIVTLVTCWPLGTDLSRLMVRGEIV